MAPSIDIILVREVYELLFDRFVQQEVDGIGGAMLLGSAGGGVETFSEYLNVAVVPSCVADPLGCCLGQAKLVQSDITYHLHGLQYGCASQHSLRSK